MKGLDGPVEDYLVREKNLEQELSLKVVRAFYHLKKTSIAILDKLDFKTYFSVKFFS